MDNVNLKNFRKILISMNSMYNTIYNDDVKLPVNKKHMIKYYNGLNFIIYSLWKIFLIKKSNLYDNDEKLNLIKNIPNPGLLQTDRSPLPNASFSYLNMACWLVFTEIAE